MVWEHFFIFPYIGMSSSQLTFTPSFFRGVGLPPTSTSLLSECHLSGYEWQMETQCHDSTMVRTCAWRFVFLAWEWSLASAYLYLETFFLSDEWEFMMLLISSIMFKLNGVSPIIQKTSSHKRVWFMCPLCHDHGGETTQISDAVLAGFFLPMEVVHLLIMRQAVPFSL